MDDLAPLAFAGFAHFTAVQVRDGRVRGLDLHLDRLRTASTTLFGAAMPDDQVRAHLSRAVRAGPDELSASVFAFLAPGAAEPDLLVRTTPPASAPTGPLALLPTPYEQVLPTIWNLACWDGSAVVWPAAGLLTGTTMGIVRRQLERAGVPQRDDEITLDDVASTAGCVVMNSWTPGVAVHRIGAVGLPSAAEFVELLHRAYLAEPLDPV